MSILTSALITSGLSGLILGLTAGLAPGPMLTLVISHTLRYRVREGVKVALAPLITDPPIIGLALVLSMQLQEIEPALGALSLLGGLYLFYLGFETLQVDTRVLHPAQSAPQSVLKGVITNFLNPHPYMFWLTVGVPLLSPQGENPVLAGIIFLVGFYVCLVGAKMALAGLVGSSKRLVQGRVYTWTMRFLGLALWIFALLFVRQAFILLKIWT